MSWKNKAAEDMGFLIKVSKGKDSNKNLKDSLKDKHLEKKRVKRKMIGPKKKRKIGKREV